MTAPVVRVPDGRVGGGPEAWQALRSARLSFWREAFARFRYGDGFSHSRALALQLSLAFMPLVIATVGLSSALGREGFGQVLRLTLTELTPGGSNALIRSTLEREDGARLALWSGLAFAVATLTTAMGQVERGANRIYGIERDRPSRLKYGRALLLAVVAGVPAMVGSGVLLAGAQFGDVVEQVYDVDDDVVMAAAVPVGVLMVVWALLAMLRLAPRRRQPGWGWLALGAGVAATLWVAFTGVLVAYIQLSGSFGIVYGPLTGVIALLLWTQVTAVAILFGLAVTAQLEAAHLGLAHGATVDPEVHGPVSSREPV